MKITGKQMLMLVLQGSGVVVLTPFLAGLISDISIFAIPIIPGKLDVASALMAGVATFLVGWAIEAFDKR